MLVGVLLAHPDSGGEGRVLLEHFGLTARDVLPADYPKFSIADLKRAAAAVDPDADPQLGPEALSVLGAAHQSGNGRIALKHLLGALLGRAEPLLWQSAFAARGTEWTQVLHSYQSWLAAAGSRATVGLVAGDSLREWLIRENPRTPVDLPVYAPDRINAERDLVGIQTEADAFAYLIASCDLKPPLAIGLFGDWGSGKSFLMRAIDQRLAGFESNVRDEDQAALRVWKNIVRIEFNAWEYVQGNLWAALLERIFGELGSLQPRLVESWRAPTENELATVQQQAADIARRVKAARKQHRRRKRDVAKARKATADAEAAAENRTSEEQEKRARELARQALRGLWGWLPVVLLDRRSEDLVVALRDARVELARGKPLLGAFWRRPLHVFLVSVFALLVPLAAYLLTRVKAPPVVAILGGLAAAVPVLTSTLGVATRWARERLDRAEEADKEVQAEIHRPVQEAEGALNKAQEALQQAEQKLQEANLQRDRADECQRELKARLDELTPGRILVAFADQRSTEYGRRLGLLAQVRRDLGKLEQEIAANNDVLRARLPQAAKAKTADHGTSPWSALVGPATSPADHRNTSVDHVDKPEKVPNRIVLYIDDLDRCPPAKVVDVLEAVHLLLSFEMFVVVVAVDSRWLTSALTNQLVALRSATDSAGQPTPKDYLEKIFQVPFWVQPLVQPGREQLLHGLLIDSVGKQPEADGGSQRAHDGGGLHVGEREEELTEAMLLTYGTEVRLDTSPLVLTPADLAFFESLAPLLGDTPRRVKRYVNTCQLLFAMAPPLPKHGPFPPSRAAVALVAAISEGLPTIADRLLRELEGCSPSNPVRTSTQQARGALTLTAFLDSCTGIAADERDRLQGWLASRPEWQAAQLASLDLRTDMIRRLRFDKPSSVLSAPDGAQAAPNSGQAAPDATPAAPGGAHTAV